MNDWQEEVMEEAVMAYFKLLHYFSCRSIAENQKHISLYPAGIRTGYLQNARQAS